LWGKGEKETLENKKTPSHPVIGGKNVGESSQKRGKPTLKKVT